MMMHPMDADDLSSPILGHIPIGQIIIGAAFVVAVGLWMIRMSRRTKPLENFLRDWNGEPERPGVPRKPGMMERMGRVDEYMEHAPTAADIIRLEAKIDKKADADEVEVIRAQVTENTGVIKVIGGLLRIERPGEDEQ